MKLTCSAHGDAGLLAVKNVRVGHGCFSLDAGIGGEISEARVLVCGQGSVGMRVEMLATVDLRHNSLELVFVVLLRCGADLQVLHN